MTKNYFIVDGKKYSRNTIESFFRIYCIGCEICKEKETCYKIL